MFAGNARGGVARRGLIQIVQALYECSDIFLPLKTVCSVILTIHNTLDRVSTNNEQLKELEDKLETVLLIVAKYKQHGGIETLSARIRTFSEAIQLQVNAVEHLRNRPKVTRIAEGKEDANKISKAFRTMCILCDVFQMDTQLNIERMAWETQKTVEETEKIVRETDETVKVILQRLKSGETTSVMERLRHEMTSYKTRLSSYGDPHGCLEGTRIKILEDLETWALDGDGCKVYWLVGMAGTGKSTISHTLCEILDHASLLGASFFCSRASTKTNNARLIIPTIAHALATASPTFKSKLVEAIEADDTLPEPTYSRLEVQFNKLIRDPLRTSLGPDTRTKVVVIDAVDECSNLTVVWSLIILILQAAPHIPLKIFITSRDEGPIRRAFDSASSLRERFVLHEVERDVVEGDIRHYVETSLSQIQSPGRGHTPEAWPSRAEMSTLVNQCGRLFIYAATVIRYIMDPCGTPSRRLSNITSQSTTIFQASIDDLYGQILEQACTGMEPNEVSETRDLALLIVFLQTPLPIQAIASLSAPQMTTYQLRRCLSPLNSVVYVPDNDDAAVTLFHTSFFDFVTDPTRCTPQRCRPFKALVASEGHRHLVLKCLSRMNASLKYNMCCAPEEMTTSCRKKTIANSPDNIDEISEALRYSCVYWATHLAGAQPELPCAKIMTALDHFLRTHLLHWIECLSVLGELGSGIQSLQIASTTLSRVRSADIHYHGSHLLVDDALRCLQMSFEAVQKHPMEIYRSSLVWLPKKSLVRKVYRSSVSQAPAITLGLSDTWGPTELTVHSGSPVTAVAYSQDGKRVASGSYDNTVWVWNAITGEVQVKLEGHTGAVWSVAFSEDGNRVISGSEDNTIRIWNADTGEVEATLEGHTGAVWSAKFSRDGSQVISGSYDSTVRIWNTTGNMKAKLEGHSGSVWSVASSHDGSRVISGSSDTVGIWDVKACRMVAKMEGVKGSVWSVAFFQESNRVVAGSEDNTVWIWDATTGEMLGKLEGHSGSVWSVAFSHDGRRVVSGSSDNTIRIWDVDTGKMEALLEGHTGYVWSVKFSPDSRRVLSGSDDNTLRIWNAATGEIETKVGGRDVPVEFSQDVSASNDTLVHTQNTTTGEMKTKQECHTGRVWSVVFSLDGSRVVSGSDDKTVRIWNAATGATEATLEGHTGSVKSVAFSPDCRLVVSGSEDTMVMIWNTMTGKMKVMLAGHTGSVLSVTFSYDGSKVISGSEDKTVRIWDVMTGQMEAKLEGHTNSVLSVAFSPDGNRAVSGSYDKTVCIWNVTTSEMEVQLEGHTGWVWSVAFSQDGSRVVSGSGDNTVRVWSVRTGEMEEEREAYTGSVSSVAISQDGSRVISGSSDNADRISIATMEAKLHGHLDSAKLVALSLDSKQVQGSFGQGTSPLPPPLLLSIAHDRNWIQSPHGDCWIPAHYRDILSSSFSGSRACFGYPDGRVIILDMAVVNECMGTNANLGTAITHAQQATAPPAKNLAMDTCLIVPQIALEHAKAHESSIGMAFDPVCTTTDAAFIIQVGFNEDMLRSRQGALQEIYIFLNFDIQTTHEPQVLDRLSHILSPFPCTLHTPSVDRQLSIIGRDGSILPHDEMWAVFRSCGIYTPTNELLAEDHISPTKVPISVGAATLSEGTSGGAMSVGGASGSGQTSGDAGAPFHSQRELLSTPGHGHATLSGDDNHRDGRLTPIGNVTLSPRGTTTPRTLSLLAGGDGGPDPSLPTTAMQNDPPRLEVPLSTALKIKWTQGEGPNTSQEFKTTSRLFLNILAPKEQDIDSGFKPSLGPSIVVGFNTLHIGMNTEPNSQVRYDLHLARAWISASSSPSLFDWSPGITSGHGDTSNVQEATNKSRTISFTAAAKPSAGLTHTRGSATGKELIVNLSKIHADPCHSDDANIGSIQWMYDIDDTHERKVGRHFKQLPQVKFGFNNLTQRPIVGVGLLVTWSLPTATDQNEPPFPLSLFTFKNKQKHQPAFRNFLQKVTVSLQLEGLAGACYTENAVLSGTSGTPQLTADDGEQCRKDAVKNALDEAGIEVLRVSAAFDTALFGCRNSAGLEGLEQKFMSTAKSTI